MTGGKLEVFGGKVFLTFIPRLAYSQPTRKPEKYQFQNLDELQKTRLLRASHIWKRDWTTDQLISPNGKRVLLRIGWFEWGWVKTPWYENNIFCIPMLSISRALTLTAGPGNSHMWFGKRYLIFTILARLTQGNLKTNICLWKHLNSVEHVRSCENT